MARTNTRRRFPDANLNPWVAGGMFAAGAFILGHALQRLTREGSAQPLVIGGVDLSNVDFSAPFMVNFSTPGTAKAQVKSVALHRLRTVLEAFRQWQPGWLYQPDADVASGRLILYVFPVR
jgi:hypothetical protein